MNKLLIMVIALATAKAHTRELQEATAELSEESQTARDLISSRNS